MGVLTWLPRELRERLAALDPVASAAPVVARPDVERVLARAQDTALPDRDGGDAVGDRSRDARRPRRLLAVAGAIIVVVGVVTGVTVLTRSTGGNEPTGAAGSASLYGVSWTDVSSGATVVFAAGSAHTSDGCESRTQHLRVSRRQLRLGTQIGVASTCGGLAAPRPGSPGYAEYQRQQAALERFYTVLGSSPAWSVSHEWLVLTTPSGVSIRLTTKGSAPLTLPGSVWVLQDVITPEPHSLADALAGPELTFDTHGGFHASDSRDTVTGTARIIGDTVKFRTLTRTHHERAATNKEQLIETVDTILNSTVTFQIEHNHLRLIRSGGTAGELIYFPRPER
jgi:META domain